MLNDHQNLKKVAKDYMKAYKLLQANVLPLLQAKVFDQIREKHFEVAKQAFYMAKSFLDRWEEVAEEERSELQDFHQKIEAQSPKLRKIAARVKQLLMNQAQIKGDVETVLAELEAQKEVVRQGLQNLSPKLKQLLDI